MVQSRAVASRLKHVFDMLLEIEMILFSGDLSYETFLFLFLLQKFFASYTRQLATFVGRFSRATKVAPCMVALSCKQSIVTVLYTLQLQVRWSADVYRANTVHRTLTNVTVSRKTDPIVQKSKPSKFPYLS